MGATGGLGKAFAFSLAKEGYSLLLTGRSMEKLSALKAELQAVYPTLECHYYAVNLAEEGERKALMDWIVSEKYNLSLLANVAGVDIQKGVEAYTQEKVSLQCRVNLEAAVDLCRFAVQHRGKALEIINVSSVSGIYPMPYFAILQRHKKRFDQLFHLPARGDEGTKRFCNGGVARGYANAGGYT